MKNSNPSETEPPQAAPRPARYGPKKQYLNRPLIHSPEQATKTRCRIWCKAKVPLRLELGEEAAILLDKMQDGTDNWHWCTWRLRLATGMSKHRVRRGVAALKKSGVIVEKRNRLPNGEFHGVIWDVFPAAGMRADDVRVLPPRKKKIGCSRTSGGRYLNKGNDNDPSPNLFPIGEEGAIISIPERGSNLEGASAPDQQDTVPGAQSACGATAAEPPYADRSPESEAVAPVPGKPEASQPPETTPEAPHDTSPGETPADACQAEETPAEAPQHLTPGKWEVAKLEKCAYLSDEHGNIFVETPYPGCPSARRKKWLAGSAQALLLERLVGTPIEWTNRLERRFMRACLSKGWTVRHLTELANAVNGGARPVLEQQTGRRLCNAQDWIDCLHDSTKLNIVDALEAVDYARMVVTEVPVIHNPEAAPAMPYQPAEVPGWFESATSVAAVFAGLAKAGRALLNYCPEDPSGKGIAGFAASYARIIKLHWTARHTAQMGRAAVYLDEDQLAFASALVEALGLPSLRVLRLRAIAMLKTILSDEQAELWLAARGVAEYKPEETYDNDIYDQAQA